MKPYLHSNVLPCALACLAVLAAIGLHRLRFRTPPAADAYHANIKRVVDDIPERIGLWEGEEMPIPPAATALLHPNALMGRRYVRPADGLAVSVVVVQCEDSRDMGGHYPPICYKAHGWTPVGTNVVHQMRIGDLSLPVVRYSFERAATFDAMSRCVVYNVLLLPGAGGVPGIAEVRRAAGDPKTRLYGAAQLQFLLDAEVPDSDQILVVQEFLNAFGPVLAQIVQSPAAAGSP